MRIVQAVKGAAGTTVRTALIVVGIPVFAVGVVVTAVAIATLAAVVDELS